MSRYSWGNNSPSVECGVGEGQGLKTHLKFLFIMLVTNGWVSHLFNALQVLGLIFPGLFPPLYPLQCLFKVAVGIELLQEFLTALSQSIKFLITVLGLNSTVCIRGNTQLVHLMLRALQINQEIKSDPHCSRMKSLIRWHLVVIYEMAGQREHFQPPICYIFYTQPTQHLSSFHVIRLHRAV